MEWKKNRYDIKWKKFLHLPQHSRQTESQARGFFLCRLYFENCEVLRCKVCLCWSWIEWQREREREWKSASLIANWIKAVYASTRFVSRLCVIESFLFYLVGKWFVFLPCVCWLTSNVFHALSIHVLCQFRSIYYANRTIRLMLLFQSCAQKAFHRCIHYITFRAHLFLHVFLCLYFHESRNSAKMPFTRVGMFNICLNGRKNTLICL